MDTRAKLEYDGADLKYAVILSLKDWESIYQIYLIYFYMDLQGFALKMTHVKSP